MSEMNEFEQLLKEQEENQQDIRKGAIVSGEVIEVKPDEIVLNLGGKLDGVITRNEYTNDSSVTDLTQVVKEGDKIDAKVINANDGNGSVILSYRRMLQEKSSERIEAAYNNQEVLTATVTKVLNGGLSVTVDDTRVFIPASLVSDTYVKDLTIYDGKEVSFIITEFNPYKKRIIGDIRALILKEKEERLKELLASLKVGDVIEEGVVKNVTKFGAFIDLGGADGLLHISEMSWGRVDDPKKHYKSGDKVRVFVKDIKEDKIALSRKFPDENPWNDAAEKYAIGKVVTGKVARMTDFGAFVSLAPGVDALLHVSQISREHVDKPSDVLQIGQEIEAKIVDFNEESHKISLSIKALQAPQKKRRERREREEDYADVVDVDIEAVGRALARQAQEEEAAKAAAEAEKKE